MTHIVPFPARKSYLTDGAVHRTKARREAMASAMGAELVLAKAYRDRDDARRALYASPQRFARIDIEILVDDAMQWAYQAVVAAAMSGEEGT